MKKWWLLAATLVVAGGMMVLHPWQHAETQPEAVPPEGSAPEEEAAAPADSAEGEETAAMEEEPAVDMPEPAAEDFVRVRDYIPDIEVELMYATDRNFTGTVIYDFDDAWLRYGTVKKLAAAQELFRQQGYRLKIWDAFRPVSAQFRLWDVYPDARFVADPRKGFSSHSRGNTVDVTLVDAEGGTVEMPTGFDDFSEKAHRDYGWITDPAVVEHVKLLEDTLTACGFVPYVNEWWHYSDEQSYPVGSDFEPPAASAE